MPLSKNPWVDITAGDYLGHMRSPEVQQHQMLNRMFKQAYTLCSPKAFAVLGCGTGNGLEHVEPQTTAEILAIDINPGFLDMAKKALPPTVQKSAFVLADLNSYEMPRDHFDQVHAALVFEYTDVPKLVSRIGASLKNGGILSVVFQLPSTHVPMITPTTVQSINQLSSIMKLVEIRTFYTLAKSANLMEFFSDRVRPTPNKEFMLTLLRKG